MTRDGVSLAPVLKNPTVADDRDVLLPGIKPGEYTMMNRDWRYIHYADDTEELYHVKKDPNEWDNLASLPKYELIKKELQASAPKSFAEPGSISADRKLEIKGEGFKWVSKKNGPGCLQGSDEIQDTEFRNVEDRHFRSG